MPTYKPVDYQPIFTEEEDKNYGGKPMEAFQYNQQKKETPVDYQPIFEEPKKQAIPTPESRKAGVIDYITAIPKGIYAGVTRELPEMIGGAMERVGVAPETGKAIKEWAQKEEEKQPERGGVEWALYEAGKMMGPSILPMGIVGTGARVILGGGKLLKTADTLLKAGKAIEAAEMASKAKGAFSLANKIGAGGTAALFGLSQAQQTVDSAKEQGVDVGVADYITGAIEAFGEYYGTKYLGKMLGLTEGQLIKPTVETLLKTLGVEVGTEMGQNFGEAVVEKLAEIRPSAEPTKEALLAVAPTSLMTLMTFGLASAGGKVTGKPKDMLQEPPPIERGITEPTPPPTEPGSRFAQERGQGILDSIARARATTQTSAIPIDLTKPQPQEPMAAAHVIPEEIGGAFGLPTVSPVEEIPPIERQVPLEQPIKPPEIPKEIEIKTKLGENLKTLLIQAEAGLQEAKDKEITGAIPGWTQEVEKLKGQIAAIEKETAKPTGIKAASEAQKTRQVQKSTEDIYKSLPVAAGAVSNKQFGRWIEEKSKSLEETKAGEGEKFMTELATTYGVDRAAPNFASQLKKSILEKGILLPTMKETKPVTPEKPVLPIVETSVISETKPHIGLEPGTKDWMNVWKEHPELQEEMAAYAKSLEEAKVNASSLKTPDSVAEVGATKETVAVKEIPKTLEEEEILPKRKALDLINTNVTNAGSSYDVLDGIFHMATKYGQEYDRSFQNLNEKDSMSLTKQIQQIWFGTKKSALHADTENKSPDIISKIQKTNALIKTFSKGKPGLFIPSKENKAGRPLTVKEITQNPLDVLDEIEKQSTFQTEDFAQIQEIIKHMVSELQSRTKRGEPSAGALEYITKERTIGEKLSKVFTKEKGERRAEILELFNYLKQLKTEGIKSSIDTTLKASDELQSLIEEQAADDADFKDYAADVEILHNLDGINLLPINYLFKEQESVMNKFLGKPWAQYIKDRAEIGSTYVKDKPSNVLDFIKGQHNPGESEYHVAELLNRFWGKELGKVNIYFTYDENRGRTYYDLHDNIIHVALNSKANIEKRLLHEITHSLSSHIIHMRPELQAEINKFIDASIKGLPVHLKFIFEKYKNNIEGVKKDMWYLRETYGRTVATLLYAHSAPYEFIADVWGNRDLQNHLQQIKLSEKPNDTLWAKIVRFLNRIIFKNEDVTLLNKIMEFSLSEVFPKNVTFREMFQNDPSQYLSINLHADSFMKNALSDLKNISNTNIDIKSWEKLIPMHILGKNYEPARLIKNAWVEGQRMLNKLLFNYEFDVDEKGKQTVKKFLRLSSLFKAMSAEQKLFDRLSVEGDVLRKNLTHADAIRIGQQSGIHTTPEQLNKAFEAYSDIRKQYSDAWNWYWKEVKNVALRIYERQPWNAELKDVMINQGTQISDEVIHNIENMYGRKEVSKFKRARTSMLKAWKAVEDSEKHMVEGYMPRMRKQGEYRVDVFNEKGELTNVEFGTNKLDALRVKYRLEKENPGSKVDTSYEPPTAENIFREFDVKDLQAFLKQVSNLIDEKGQYTPLVIDKFFSAFENHIAHRFKARGFRQHQIQRVGEAGLAIKGYKEENVHEGYLAYIRNAAGSVRKMNFAFDANNVLRDIDLTQQGELFNYLRQYRDDMLRNEIKADKVISQVRSFAYLYYLAANIKASAVNGVQNFVLGIPLYARALRDVHAQKGQKMSLPQAYAIAFKEITKAMKDTFAYHLGKKLSTEEMGILQRGKMDGDTGAMQLQYMTGVMDKKFSSRYAYIVNLLGTPFSFVETTNREAALLAFHRMYKNLGADTTMAYTQARSQIYNVHFPYGKHNYPELVRAAGLLGQTGHLLSTFRSYSIMYVTTILNSFKGANGQVSWKNCDVFFGSLAMLTLLGGLTAPWIDDILDVYERMSGNPVRTKIRERLRSMGGDIFSYMGMHGIPAALGVDITGSLKIGVPFIGAGGIEETITGAYAGIEQKFTRSIEAFKLDDYYRMIEELSPAFISNALKSVREYKEGATTVEGKPITDAHHIQYQPTSVEAVSQALGFRVEKRAELSEELRTYKNSKLAMDNKRREIIAKFRKANPSDRGSIIDEVRDFNEAARSFGGGVAPLRMSSLKRGILEKLDKRRLLFEYMFSEE